MLEDEVLQEILELIRSDKPKEEIAKCLENYHDSDIADVVPFLSEEERSALYELLGAQSTSDVFTYLENVEEYIEELDNEQAADIIELMDADDALDVLEELDEEDKQEIVELMEEEAVEDILLIDGYEEDQIGSKMTTNYIAINVNSTIKQAMRQVINEAPENDNINTIYVINDDGSYYGLIDLKDLIVARSNVELLSIVKTSYPTLLDTDLVSDCIVELKEYALEMIPVLNKDNILIGVITSSDIVEVIDEELSEDYAKLAGLTDEEEIDEPVHKSLRKRLPWLILLLVLGLGVSLIISSFEGVIASIPMVVFFQSTILAMAGNVGTQSLAVTIQNLNENELDAKTVAKMVFKEVRIGFLNGLSMGIISFGMVLLFLVVKGDPITGDVFLVNDALHLSFIVLISLVLALTFASLVGSAIPLFLKKIKIDPAVASGPLITTINDVIAVVTYYGLCLLLFSSIIN